jgi:hypothetical protein
LVETDLGAGSPGPFDLDYQRKGSLKRRVRQMLPSESFAYDVHATIGVIRAWQGEVGDEASTFILSGRRLWRNTLRVGARETIRTALGKHPAVRLDGVAQRVTRSMRDDKRKKPRHYSVWLSDDANRIPLLVLANTEFGELRAEMTDYSRPDERLSAR